MSDELEFEVWHLAQQSCGASAFVRLIEEAVDGFERRPGYDPLVRMHASGIGMMGVRVLRRVLTRRGIDAGPSAGYVELRSRLKTHLRNQLQWHLVKGDLSTDEMKADQLGRDVGL